MAAALLSNSLGSDFSRTRSGGNRESGRDILVETMQLVEPRKEIKVPDHLLESKIYARLDQNAVIQAQPAVLHFGGFEPGKTIKQVFNLANVSDDVQRMHVIPPQTKYFYIRYKKGDRLVPGLALECTVEFTPDEWRYYYDCIRVHCKGEENLVIPLHAYPVMNTADFPQHVKFPPVPVGHKRSKVIPLRCHAPIDFEFTLSYVQPHPAFRVEPMSGVVPASGEVDVLVTFAPTEFSTACMVLQLVISQFNAKPLLCNFSGSSAPGLAKELTEKSTKAEMELLSESTNVLDPRAVSPLDRARRKRKLKKSLVTSRGTLIEDTSRVKEYKGVMVPTNVDTPYAVSKVLNQEPGKLKTKDLREVVLAKEQSAGAPTRQMKEAVFDMAVRQNVYEERQNQLRWQVKLGDREVALQTRLDVVEARQAAWEEYLLKRGDPVEEDELARVCTTCVQRRTHRAALSVPAGHPTFDMYKNDAWAVRFSLLNKFQQAARKIIVRSRADKKLVSLRRMVAELNERKGSAKGAGSGGGVHGESDASDLTDSQTAIEVSKVTSVTFATYIAPEVKDDMAVDALGAVPCQPTQVVVKDKVPFFNLKVPQQYRLAGYREHEVHSAATSYVPPRLARPMRTGAEDEIVTLGDIPVSMEPVTTVDEGDMRVEDVTMETPTPAAPPAEIAPLKPPPALFRPMDYPPLHIFNPAPGLQVFQPPLPYAATDPDFHLCPLPRYRNLDPTNPDPASRPLLDRQDTIKGLMSWKRFPSQGLTSLANTPTLTNVWVPRWSDPFGLDLMPTAVPALSTGLQQDDKEAIVEESGDGEEDSVTLTLTPDMVKAEFALIDADEINKDEKTPEASFPHGSQLPATNVPVDTHGHVPIEQRERELQYFLNRKYNRLGSKLRERVQHIDSLKNREDLILQ